MRNLIWYFSRKIKNDADYSKYSKTYLGSIYNKDHATVHHGLKNICIWNETDKKFREKVKKIKNLIDIGLK